MIRWAAPARVVSGAGSAAGLLLGGALTEYLNWRWTFFVNVPLAGVTVVGALLVIREPVRARKPPSFGVPGAELASVGSASLVYGVMRAEQEGWVETWTVSPCPRAALHDQSDVSQTG
ncbi:MFS transporter [Streptomyces mirabilis]|uniref:MFS transporter n=1 Tax=Streptomyces mirabilis TaxID=68239 RepID=UPI00333405B6